MKWIRRKPKSSSPSPPTHRTGADAVRLEHSVGLSPTAAAVANVTVTLDLDGDSAHDAVIRHGGKHAQVTKASVLLEVGERIRLLVEYGDGVAATYVVSDLMLTLTAVPVDWRPLSDV